MRELTDTIDPLLGPLGLVHDRDHQGKDDKSVLSATDLVQHGRQVAAATPALGAISLHLR